MTQLKQIIPLAIALLLALPTTQGQAQSPSTPSDPITFNAPAPPPSTGQPGRRSDAGSRGCGEESNSSSESMSLTALVPTQKVGNSTMVFGTTAAERPTFWFYVPQRSSSTAIFVLQQDGNTIYESPVELPQTAGVLSLTLPATAAPLEIGKSYHWFFKLYCRSTSPPDSFVDGWIQRESLTPNLTEQLQAATPQQQVRFYAENGFWFDALTVAAELRQINSEDAAWADLLRAIDLESVVDAAIVSP